MTRFGTRSIAQLHVHHAIRIIVVVTREIARPRDVSRIAVRPVRRPAAEQVELACISLPLDPCDWCASMVPVIVCFTWGEGS